MIGAIAEAYYGAVQKNIVERVKISFTEDLWDITRTFCERFYDLSIGKLRY